MSIESERPERETPLRGTMLLLGEDKLLYAAIVKHLANATGKPSKTSEIIRESLRCYAEKLNVTV
jgi:hypothetical protein